MPGVDPDIFARNPGSVPPSTAGFPAGPFGIGDHFSFIGAANGFSWHAGTLLGHSIGDFLPEDLEQKDVCIFD